eukprot:1137164-Pelagomonas_calceolata.AAC.2
MCETTPLDRKPRASASAIWPAPRKPTLFSSTITASLAAPLTTWKSLLLGEGRACANTWRPKKNWRADALSSKP